MKTVFVATRELARTIAREEGETWADMGKDAPKGKRWAVQYKELSDVIAAIDANTFNVPTKSDIELTQALAKAFAGLDVKPAVLPKPESIVRQDVQTMQDRKGNNVTVFTKRRIALA